MIAVIYILPFKMETLPKQLKSNNNHKNKNKI